MVYALSVLYLILGLRKLISVPPVTSLWLTLKQRSNLFSPVTALDIFLFHRRANALIPEYACQFAVYFWVASCLLARSSCTDCTVIVEVHSVFFSDNEEVALILIGNMLVTMAQEVVILVAVTQAELSRNSECRFQRVRSLLLMLAAKLRQN